MEDNKAGLFCTSVLGEARILPELLVFEFDIPKAGEKPRRNRGNVDLTPRDRERDTKRFLCEQGWWHPEAACFQGHRAPILFRPQSNGIRRLEQLSVEAHMNAEALWFLRRPALSRQPCGIDAEQKPPKTKEYRSSW
jgi:hypothetical protein